MPDGASGAGAPSASGSAAAGAGSTAAGGSTAGAGVTAGGAGDAPVDGGAGGKISEPSAGSAAVAPGGGAPSGGAQPEGPGVIALCIAPEDAPMAWGAAGAGEYEPGCKQGVLGEFNFGGCRYELVVKNPTNIDPFVGGHSPCCYQSQLIACP